MSAATQDLDGVINTQGSHNPRWSVVDAQQRSRLALEANPDFFGSPQHQAKIDAVTGIVTGFFKQRGGIYVNHRENRGQPFTVIKVERPRFPTVSQARKRSEYLDPLRALGVEIVFSAQTNSYLYRLR